MQLAFKSAFTVEEDGAITGIAWPFGTPGRVGGVIEKGAFASAKTPLPMFHEHDPLQNVGVWDSVAETDEGLVVKGRLLVDDVARAREVRALIREGSVGGLSVTFAIKRKSFRKGLRIISDLDLLEISTVAVPAHPNAQITSAKSASEAIRIADAITRATSALQLERQSLK